MKRFLFFLIHVCIFGWLGYLLTHHQQPYRIIDAIGADHPAAKHYLQFQEHYNNENFLYLMTVSSKPLLEDNLLAEIDSTITNELRQIQGLKRISSISTARFLEFKDQRFLIHPFIEDNRITSQGRSLLISDPLWQNTHVDKSGHSLMTTVEMDSKLNPSEQTHLLDQLRELTSEIQRKFAGTEGHWLGTKLASDHFNREMRRQQVLITPLAMAVLGLLIFFVLRSFLALGLALYYIISVYSISALVIFNIEPGLTPYTQFALLFVFIVALEDFIHFFAAMTHKSGKTIRERARLAREDVIGPCFFTSLAEVLGFGGLVLSDIGPVRNFGLYAAAGVIAAFFICFYLIPFVMEIFSLSPEYQPDYNLSRPFGRPYLRKIHKYRRAIVVGFLAIAAYFISFLPGFTIDDNLYDKFRSHHPLTRALHAFSDNFQFTGSVDVVLPGVSSAEFLSANHEVKMRALISELQAREDNVSAVRGLPTYQHHLRTVLGKPEISEATSFSRDQDLNTAIRIARNRGYLQDYWPKTMDETMISVRVKDISSRAMVKTVKAIGDVFTQFGVPFQIEGYSRVRLVLLQEVIWGFVYSFAFAFVSIFGMFILLYRSFLWALIAIIPNVIPVLVTLGAVIMAKFPIEDSLILTLSILLGVAVNDTIHLIYGAKKRAQNGENLIDAIADSIEHSGHAVLGTNLVYILTIPLFFLSEMTVFYRMGFFLLVALILAVTTEMLLTPALLFCMREKNENSKTSAT